MSLTSLKFDGRRKTNISEGELMNFYYNESWSVSQIASYFGCTKNCIAYWLRRYHLKRRTPSQAMRLFARSEKEINEVELYNLFKNKKLKLSEIAQRYNCSIGTIMGRLRRFNIANKFSHGKRVEIRKSDLGGLYSKRKLNTYEIAEQYGTCQATIWKRLKDYGIKRRLSHSLNADVPSKEILYGLYISKGLSTWEIERRYGYSRSTTHKKLREYGLIRNRAQSHIKFPRSDFDGNLVDKAYLIGFKLGDLRARKIWEGGATISIDCASNKSEQIELIKGLFCRYGKVRIKEYSLRKGFFHIETAVNTSFSFLLAKIAPSWVFENKKHFFSFLAGFSDAEGSFFITRGQAQYSLGNYDYKLLFSIRDTLKRFGIMVRGPREQDTSLYFTKEGYGHNQNYWTLSISRKSELLKFISSIMPYSKHSAKRVAAEECKANIIERNIRFGA